MADDDLIRSREAAEILHRDVRTIHRWVDDGRLPVAIKVPGYRGGYLFHRREVEAFAADLADTDTAAG